MSAVAVESPAVTYNRVPKVTVDFWLNKLMAVTVGETAADYLSVHLDLGLSATSLIMAGFLIAALMLQFAQRKYVPLPYWLAVVMISVVGTLISDNLADNLGLPLETSSIIFAAVLITTFAVWHGCERTLSIHTIYTTRRQTFYWLAILFTFALGTSAGDLAAEGLNFGYMQAGLAYAAVIAVIAIAYYGFRLNGVLAFWLVYILTRPMGASFGDYFAQSHTNGGLGLGTTITSLVFLGCITAIIIYMSLTKEGLEGASELSS